MAISSFSVLIVEDEQAISDLLTTELTECGYLCTTALSGEQASLILADQNFDAILLDIRLPGKSGMEVLREISSSGRNAAVIIMTAVHDIETAVEAMKLGAADYITKPFDLVRVEACLQTTLNNRGSDIKRSQIEAIARGVQTRVSGAAMSSIISETVQIAKRLGIDESEIQKWTTAREKQIREGIGGLILQ